MREVRKDKSGGIIMDNAERESLQELAYIFAGINASGIYGNLQERFKGKSFNEIMQFFADEDSKIRQRMSEMTEEDFKISDVPTLKFAIRTSD